MQITAIILAGGKSSRMGTDKVLLKINEKTLLERAIELVEPWCNSIIISSNNANHEKYGFEIIPDEIEDCGPIGGVYTCLKQTKTDWNFVISVDSAFVEKEFIQYLFSKIDNSNAIVPLYKKGKEPLIALYNRNSLDVIKEMIDAGNFKMYNLVNSINSNFIDSSDWLKKYPKLFHNINRPADL